jgi:hypothetical protein
VISDLRAGSTASFGSLPIRSDERCLILWRVRNTAKQPQPLGMKVLVVFFAFGATACAITIAALIFPGGWIELVWRLNPEARIGFQRMGPALSVLLMTVVGMACAGVAFGLAKRRPWGRQLAIGIVTVNLLGDSLNALVRHDWRTLIGLPIGGAMIAYLLKGRRMKADAKIPKSGGTRYKGAPNPRCMLYPVGHGSCF